LLDLELASPVNKGPSAKELTMTRLETIATRQRRSRARDVMFAVLVVLAGIVSIESVGMAAHGAQTVIAHR
jgi:hypothetical protein